jgi:ABC-type phosphate transport system substrate-binding protein
MTRTHLLGAASAAALACLSAANCLAASTITGGGSTLAQFDYLAEFAQFNAATNTAQFGTYYESGSGSGQAAFLNDDLTCDINKVNGNNGGACTGGSGVGQPGNTVDYGASDATLSSTQISTWATYPYGQPAAGNLIQVPSMGVGVGIPVQNSAVTGNGTLILNDNDLCGVFSGKITDFSQLTLGAGSVTPTSGTITVDVRSDGSGTTFLLTNHLSAVCTNSNSAITFSATTTFANLFPNATLPGNFVASKGSSGVAAALVSQSSAIGYLSPDFTTLDPNSGATPKNTLVVAAVLNGKTAFTPTTKNITAALERPVLGSNLTPPTNATEGANPSAYVPLIQTASTGYPIVGYTTFDLAQCYADKTVSAGLIAFLNDHYTNNSYLSIENNNGFVALTNSGATKFLAVVRQHILSNKNTKPAWNVDIEDKTACKGLPGR